MRKPPASAESFTPFTDVQPLFRYQKSGRTRVYQLRFLDAGSELWVVSTERSKASRSRKLVTFDKSDDSELFIDEIRKELHLGGWAEA